MDDAALQKYLLRLFERHDVALDADEDGWLTTDGDFPTVRAQWHEGAAGAPGHLDIDVVLSEERCIEESFAGHGADTDGCTAALRAFEQSALHPLLAAGLAIRVASIPNGKDPDEFIKQNGGEAFRELINQAQGFFDWYLKRLCATNDTRTDKGRVAVLREFGEALAKTRNAVLIDTHAQKAALRLGVAVDAVRAEFKKVRTPEPRPAHDEQTDPAPTSESLEVNSIPPTPREMQLLKLLLSAAEHRAVAVAHLNFAWLANPVVKRIAERCLSETEVMNGAALLAWFAEDPEARGLVASVLADSQQIPQAEKQIVDVLRHLRNDYLTAELQRLTREVTHPDLPESRRLEILQQQQALRAQRLQPLA